MSEKEIAVSDEREANAQVCDKAAERFESKVRLAPIVTLEVLAAQERADMARTLANMIRLRVHYDG